MWQRHEQRIKEGTPKQQEYGDRPETKELTACLTLVLWKRPNTETDTKKRKPTPNDFFEAFPVFFKNYRKSLKSQF